MSHWYLIHGAASSRLTWSRQLKVLPSVTRAELPHFPDTDAQDLLAQLTEWCLRDLKQPSVIVGHSMGGAIAQLMALRAPHMVEGLVLVGTGPHLPVNPALIDALRADPQAALQRIVKLSLSKNPEENLLQNSVQQASQIDTDRAYHEFLACTFFDVRAQLPLISGPKVIITGADDRMTPSSLTQTFLASWPGAPYYTIKDAGHMMMLEQPEHFNNILLEIAEQFNW